MLLLKNVVFNFKFSQCQNILIFYVCLCIGSECNPSRLTFDGVDRMGERLAEEVLW